MNVRVGEVPGPGSRFKRRIRILGAASELWGARELVRTLAERELRARYKQAVLGFAWAFVTPVALMLVFVAFVTKIAAIPTEGASYPLFAYLGLLVWTFFSSAITTASQSLLMNSAILNKVYCPREVFPLSSVGVAGVDTAVAVLALPLLFLIEQEAPTATPSLLPGLVALTLVALAFTTGLALLLSAAIVYLRDLRHLVPLVLQLGIFATPVAYGMDSIPRRWRSWYSLVNPLAPVIDGYRRLLLWGRPPDWHLVGLGACTAVVVLGAGYKLFKHLETGLADIA